MVKIAIKNENITSFGGIYRADALKTAFSVLL